MAIPKHWQSTRLSEVLSECDDRCGTLSVPVLSVTKTRGLMLASERFGRVMHGKNLAAYRLARRGTLVADPMLLWDGSIGIQDVVDAGAVSPDYRVYCVSDQLDLEYLRNLIRSPAMVRRYQDGARGTNVRRNRITRDDFLAIPFERPPLPEQKKIAAVLSSVDETIAKTESVIAQLQIVKKAMMEQLLTKGMPGRHTRFKQTEIGEIPEEWEVVPLYSVATVQTGIAKGKAVGEEALSVPYLRVANVQDGFIDLTEIKEIEITPEQLPRFSLQAGDVLFCEGGDADKVGRGTVWLGQITPCLHQNHVFAVRPQLSKLIPEFLSMVRSSNSGKQYFLDSAKQTTNLASINSTQLKSFPTPLPSTEEQHEIVAAIASIVAALDKEQGVLSSCQSLKSALSSSLLSGEIRVIPEVA